jgi:hypothetical protein
MAPVPYRQIRRPILAELRSLSRDDYGRCMWVLCREGVSRFGRDMPVRYRDLAVKTLDAWLEYSETDGRDAAALAAAHKEWKKLLRRYDGNKALNNLAFVFEDITGELSGLTEAYSASSRILLPFEDIPGFVDYPSFGEFVRRDKGEVELDGPGGEFFRAVSHCISMISDSTESPEDVWRRLFAEQG